MGRRRYAKRRTRAVYRALDRTMEDALELSAMFAFDHPEHAKLLEAIAAMTLEVQKQVANFYKITWGFVPGDWYSDV